MSNSALLRNAKFFEELSIQFHTENINIEQIHIPISDAKFGILKLNAIYSPMSQDVHEFIFMVDRSGSMSDKCSDGRDKMQHIIHTLKNMINYFKDNKSAKVYVNIFAFDDKIEEIVERTDINEDNIDAIIVKINRINPRSSTDIEKALISIKSTINKIQLENPTHNICNIFMTDGDATAGNCNTSYLSGLVDRNITNAFIGFGLQHDAVLLNAVSNGDNSSYYFIDKLENAGLIYGEILHGILYKLLKNPSIKITNGLIYDYKNNTWSTELKIVDIISESNKVYHITSSNPGSCCAVLKAQCIEDNVEVEYGFSIFNECLETDLSKHIFRQRTLQLLYKINKFIEKKNETNQSSHVFRRFRGFDNSTIDDDNVSIIAEQELLKTEMKNFMSEMKKYMEDNNLNNDGFMKNLCDDIYISYRTFGTKFGAMYNTARQTSQGTQRCYTVSHTPDENDRNYSRHSMRQPRLMRQTNAPTVNLYSNNNNQTYSFDDLLDNSQSTRLVTFDDDDDDMEHVISNFQDTPYLTPTATQLMREISNGNDACDAFAQSKNNYESEEEEENI